ncbi:MAG: hypothetical protein KDC79_05685 [Cyclobacteriaceae bacterium]|nr:hypothetical protein [Cyclobacteriaceae bacterium]
MSFSRFEGRLDEEKILNAYGAYLQKCTFSKSNRLCKSEKNGIMAYEEFREYYILELLGRASEFTSNIARDYQYSSLMDSLLWPESGI